LLDHWQNPGRERRFTMGGPWRSSDFDPVAWRPPAPRVEARSRDAAREAADHHLMGIVISYIVSVLALSGAMLALVVRFGHSW
jgi:hypothetical protein